MVRLTFHGAAETVTGSKYLLETGSSRVLIDCGLFQGLKALRLKNWDRPPFDPRQIDAIVLTHAHLDHVGYLPRLVRLGYKGPIYATPATVDLAELILLDAAKIQENDAEYANRKGYSKHHPALPLFDSQDVQDVLDRLKCVGRSQWFQPAATLRVRYHDAGHLLGSAMAEIEVQRGSRPLRLLFSGDVGRYDAPLYHDPTPPPACDYLICESTYGDRDHPAIPVLDQVCDVVHEAMRRGGVMLVASFAVGRAQQLIYLLQVLIHQERIPALPIYLDSPMAADASDIFRHYAEDHDLSEIELQKPESAFRGRAVHLARTTAESKRLNEVRGPAVIISSAGMMTGGRILHHLERRLPDERNTIVLGGFMAEGTRGRALDQGAKTLRMHGRDVPVRAALARISTLSGHADRDELLRWVAKLPPPKRVFVTHGEKSSAHALADALRDVHGWDVVVPRLDESFELEEAA